MIRMFARARLLAILGIAVAVTPVYAAAQTEQPARSEAAKALKSDPLHVFSESVQVLSGRVTKSVVQILTSHFLQFH
jgi:heat shock protein HspQ